MISFGIETHEHIIPKQEGGEENTGGIPTLTGKILTPERSSDNPSADQESDKLPSVSSLSNLKNLASKTATQAVSQTTQTAQTQLESAKQSVNSKANGDTGTTPHPPSETKPNFET